MATQQTRERRSEYRIARSEEVDAFLEEEEQQRQRAEEDASDFASYLVSLRRAEGMSDEDKRDDDDEGELVEGDHFIDFESSYWLWVDADNARFGEELTAILAAAEEEVERAVDEDLLAEADDNGETFQWLSDELDLRKILREAGITKEQA